MPLRWSPLQTCGVDFISYCLTRIPHSEADIKLGGDKSEIRVAESPVQRIHYVEDVDETLYQWLQGRYLVCGNDAT